MTETSKGMIEELLNYEPSGDDVRLSDWEIGFLENIQGWRTTLTAPQSATLEKVWAKVFGP